MIILSKFSNFPDELSKNDELREHKLSGSDCTWKHWKMGKILEKLMKKYWKNVKNTGKVYEKILEKCKKKLEKSGKFVSPKKWEPWFFAFRTYLIHWPFVAMMQQ